MTRARARSGLCFLVLVWLALVASGCATNLGAVREFASTSSDAAQYTQLVSVYVNTPNRLARYEPESQRPVLARQAAERTAQQESLLLRQRLIQSYMDGLGQLAADGLASYDTQLDSLNRALQAAKFADQSEAAALAAVSKLLAAAATERWRSDKLVTLIERSDAPFQTVVGSLVSIVETGFVADLANEREALNKYYTELQLRSRDPAGLGALGEWREMREGQIRDREAAIGNYVVVLKTISAGHRKLYESRHDLSRVEVQAQIHQYTKRLREAVNAIRSFI
jgi:hypothetical protein